MSTSIPSAEDVRQILGPLTTGQVRKLAEASAVPFTTLWKVKTGETANPGIETIRKFLPHVETVAGGSANQAPAKEVTHG